MFVELGDDERINWEAVNWFKNRTFPEAAMHMNSVCIYWWTKSVLAARVDGWEAEAGTKSERNLSRYHVLKRGKTGFSLIIRKWEDVRDALQVEPLTERSWSGLQLANWHGTAPILVAIRIIPMKIWRISLAEVRRWLFGLICCCKLSVRGDVGPLFITAERVCCLSSSPKVHKPRVHNKI